MFKGVVKGSRTFSIEVNGNVFGKITNEQEVVFSSNFLFGCRSLDDIGLVVIHICLGMYKFITISLS